MSRRFRYAIWISMAIAILSWADLSSLPLQGADPGEAKASVPGGYEFLHPSSWTQVVVSEDPYIAKFFLTPPAEPGSEALADLEVTVYQNPQRLPLEKFFNGQERPNLFKDAVGGYKPFSAGGATGYWFDNVLGFTNYTVVALSSGGYVYEFADPQEHQADGVYLQIVQSFKLPSIPAALADSSFRYPVDGNWMVSNDFWSCDVQCWHLAEDSGRDAGTPVYAPSDGVVKHTAVKLKYGNVVVIEHALGSETVATVMGHLRNSGLNVSVGQSVTKGYLVGYLGTSAENGGWAPHIHYGVNKGSYSGDNALACDGKWVYAGYAANSCVQSDWYDPTDFNQAHAQPPIGKTDVGNYVPGNGSFWVSRSTGSSLQPVMSWSNLVGYSNEVRFIADYNGDGKADVGNYVPGNGSFWVSRSNGSGFDPVMQWSSLVGYSNEVRFIADYNGDGKADVGNYVPANGQFYVSISTGSGFLPVTLWSNVVGYSNEERFIADYNGDGKTDVGNYVPANGQFYVSISTGNGFQPVTLWSNVVGYSWESRFLGDYNGDGKVDIGNYVTGNGQFYVSVSTGSSFLPVALWSNLVGYSNEIRFVADYTGDGKTDVGNYVPANGQFYVSVSTGSGLLPVTLWSNVVGLSWEVRFLGDYNGDRKVDVGNYVPGNGQFWVSVSTGNGFLPTALWSNLVGYSNEVRFIANFDGQ